MARREYPKFQPLPFRLNVYISGRYYKLTVLQTLKGIGEEHYKVMARNKTLVFSTNKPIIERRDLKDFPWTWKLIQGESNSKSAYDAIVECLEAHLRGKPNPGGLHGHEIVDSVLWLLLIINL